MLLKSIQGRSGKPYAKPKASSSQRHHLHQQHRWDLRVQANGKNDEKNRHDVVFKHCDIDLIESNLVEDDIDLAKYPILWHMDTTADIDFCSKVNLEVTFTLSWLDTRYKPNEVFFVGDNKLVFFSRWF